ncbi:MAG: hypothetical protein U5N86_09900 [Planctomycetota bacterium]|nr:hypothetical protein [Planctomycetota bacterium]
MKDGEIVQVGTPADIYYEPADLYVARFFGDNNVLPASIFDIEVSEHSDEENETYVVARPTSLKATTGGEGESVQLERAIFKGEFWLGEFSHSSRYRALVSFPERPEDSDWRLSLDGPCSSFAPRNRNRFPRAKTTPNSLSEHIPSEFPFPALRRPMAT